MKTMTLSNRENLIVKRARFACFLLVLIFFALLLPGSDPNWLARISLRTAAAPQTTAPDDVWQDVDETLIGNTAQRQIIPSRYRTVRLNKEALGLILAKVPLEFADAGRINPAEMAFPMPDGSFARFAVLESPIMEPDLAKAFPEIRTYRGQGIDDPTAIMRFDWTPEGLHVIVLSASGTVYIDPYARANNHEYISYNKQDHQSDKPFQCLVSEDGVDPNRTGTELSPQSVVNGGVLRTYRIAVAATGEYTIEVGGTVPSAFSAIATNINRVNAIYERDLSVRFMLVSGQANIIFTNPTTDPYTNSDPFAMLGQNQTTLDNVIGSSNYDIGHVFGSGNLGLGQLNAVCNGGLKARGVSAHFTPEDRFAIEMVSHEIGHQFGAGHTFNGTLGSCGPQRSADAAYEPGAGSTIMAYAFFCPFNSAPPNQNLQGHKDDYFHIKNLEQMLSHMNGGGGCANQASTSNSPPTVDAGLSYTVPRATPFNLTATGSDPNGDSVTYTWEEYDVGPPSPPDTDANGLIRPVFRSYPGTASPTRTFPALKYILDSANVPPTNLFPFTSSQQYLSAEALPVITRTMTFQVTARDNHSGGGGISSDNMQLNVTSSAGPFYVTQPNTATIWTAGAQATVAWNVANTNTPPVNCANVKITLSTDGGTTFPVVLAAGTPNDGSQAVTVPSLVSTSARVRVEAVGNIFFDISDTNFIIPASGCSYSISPPTRLVGPAEFSRTISVMASQGCFWKAKSNVPWIRIDSGDSGNDNGNGTVSYTILQNQNGATRVGTISVAGRTQTITQTTSLTCSFSISPSTDSFASNGGTGRIDITTSTICNWTASSNAPWIVIISGSAGLSNGTMLYAVTPNSSAGSRTGSLHVAGYSFTITQYGTNAGSGATQATFVGLDTTTQGSWHNNYGADGYNVINDAASYPSYAVVTPSGNSSWTWAASTTEPRALQNAASTDRIMACWFSADSFNIGLNLTDGATHQIAIYCMDFDRARTQRISIVDPATGAVLDSRDVTDFGEGQYLVWNIKGNVIITVSKTIFDNGVVSGIFFDTLGGSSSPINVALASNGATVTASSTYAPGYPASGAINGDRKGLNWSNGGGWADGTDNVFPDWIQVNFNGSKTINEIDVFTVQDDDAHPVEPTLSLTFSVWGITHFSAQYWNGSTWITVPSGTVSGNNKVWRQFTFSPITTDRIRIFVTGALFGNSRITEVEAYTGAPPPPTNVALASNGATVSASSTYAVGYPASGAINGDRKGLNWSNGGGWADGTDNVFPDWIQVNFNGSKTINEIDVFTVQDDDAHPVEPTLSLTFSVWGITAFNAQYWNGTTWVTVPNGTVSGNNKVWRQFTFSPITTDRIRIFVTNALFGNSRITEVEAYSSGG